MLNPAQRLDLLRIALEISKSNDQDGASGSQPLDDVTLKTFRKLRAELEKGGALDDANVSDVKDAIDVASSLDELME